MALGIWLTEALLTVMYHGSLFPAVLTAPPPVLPSGDGGEKVTDQEQESKPQVSDSIESIQVQLIILK